MFVTHLFVLAVKSTISQWNYLRDGYIRRRRLANTPIPSGSGHEAKLKKENAKKWPHYAVMDVIMEMSLRSEGEPSIP